MKFAEVLGTDCSHIGKLRGGTIFLVLGRGGVSEQVKIVTRRLQGLVGSVRRNKIMQYAGRVKDCENKGNRVMDGNGSRRSVGCRCQPRYSK